MAVFLSTFGIIFLAELGDKTQLTAMALATRYPWKKIFLGLAAAFALLNVGAVLVGKLLFAVVPLFWIKLISGGLFLFFGVTTFLAKGADSVQEEKSERTWFTTQGPVLTAFLMIFVAELGDKTQIVTASLAAQHDSPLAVFSGSTIALWSVSLIGMFLGRQLTRFIPLTAIQKGAACLFLAFGIVVLFQAFTGA